MNVPKGYTEEQVLTIIDGIVDYMAPLFAFGYYDVDDIKQEGRIYALEVLPRYKPGRELKNFLFTHIRNRLINLKRDKLSRPNPCTKCPNCDFPDKMECPRYNIWKTRNTAKKNLAEPYLDNVDIAIENRNNTEKFHRAELLNIIDEHLPVNMRRDFLRILEGCSVTQFRKNKLIIEIKSIIAKYYNGKDEEWAAK
jgi:DNA-directed RNA polymerase specialized sigma24 family protein